MIIYPTHSFLVSDIYCNPTPLIKNKPLTFYVGRPSHCGTRQTLRLIVRAGTAVRLWTCHFATVIILSAAETPGTTPSPPLQPRSNRRCEPHETKTARGQALLEGASVEAEALFLAAGDVDQVFLETSLSLLISASLWLITITIIVPHHLRLRQMVRYSLLRQLRYRVRVNSLLRLVSLRVRCDFVLTFIEQNI